MKKFISSANRVLKDWNEKFDVLGATPLKFEKRDNGGVMLNEEVLLLIKDGVYVTSAFFDIENIVLYLSDSCAIHIIMGWENEKPPYIKNVFVKPIRTRNNYFYEEY